MNAHSSINPGKEFIPLGPSVFFGSNYKIAQSIAGYSNLQKIVCEKRQFNLNIYDFAMLYEIEFISVLSKSDLSCLQDNFFDVGFSCGTGTIFNRHHMNLFDKGIWNIHYGPLPEVRGRHPISWAFLKNLPFGVTIHRIDEEIDQGEILAKAYIERDVTDTQIDIEEKIEDVICNELLRKAIENWKAEKVIGTPKGEYYESLMNEFKEINPGEYDSRYLFNLFKSQYKYGGVVIRDKKYEYCTFYNSDFPELYDGYDLFKCKDSILLAVK